MTRMCPCPVECGIMRRMATKRGWVPPRSPYGLIQEDLWSAAPESEWIIIVVCMILNCTSRKQVEKVLPEFVRRWPTPSAFVAAADADVVDATRSLGFANRRTSNLKKMTSAYIAGGWSHARELPGVCDYAAAAWEIFCTGTIPSECPNDHALTQYWRWITHQRSKTR